VAKNRTVTHRDSLSRWERVAKGRRELIVIELNELANREGSLPDADPKFARALRIAADLLEKLGEPR